MKRQKILDTVVSILSTLVGSREIQETDELLYDLGVSSMDMLALISCLEEALNIEISERMIRRVETVKDLVDLLDRKLQ